jgi:hypothetical protein
LAEEMPSPIVRRLRTGGGGCICDRACCAFGEKEEEEEVTTVRARAEEKIDALCTQLRLNARGW